MSDLIPKPHGGPLDLPDDLPGLMGMFDANLLDLAIQRSGFTIFDSVEDLTEIFKDRTSKTSDRLQAHKQLWSLFKDVAKLRGLINTATQEQTQTMPDGTVVNQRLVTTRLLNTMRTKNLNERPQQEYLVRDGYREPLARTQGEATQAYSEGDSASLSETGPLEGSSSEGDESPTGD